MAEMGIPLRRAISSERLEAYRRDSTDSEALLVARYLWNVALCEAFHPVLSGLEVALRNGIHEAAQTHFGSAWWLTDGSVRFEQVQQDQLKNAASTLARRSRQVTPSRLVAELSFGFWTGLLDRPYEQVLWPVLLKAVFPAMPRRIRTRHRISGRLSATRKLRNRAYHNEPIWRRADLLNLHQNTLGAIGRLSPAAAQMIQIVDRFPTVYQLGEAHYLRPAQALPNP